MWSSCVFHLAIVHRLQHLEPTAYTVMADNAPPPPPVDEQSTPPPPPPAAVNGGDKPVTKGSPNDFLKSE